MTLYEFSSVLTWFVLIGVIVKIIFDNFAASKTRMKFNKRLQTLDEKISLCNENYKKEVDASSEKLTSVIEKFVAESRASFGEFKQFVSKELTDMDKHLRDKLLEYGTSIAELSVQIKDMESKYQLNSLEMQEVEASLEELKEVFADYSAFLDGFVEEFGLDDSKIYRELIGRTKSIKDLVDEIIGVVRGGENGKINKNGARTVATIGTIKAG